MKQQKLKHCSFLLYNLYMENKILQQNGYNALQLSLPIDLGIKIDEDDMVISFLKALEGVNLSKHFKTIVRYMQTRRMLSSRVF